MTARQALRWAAWLGALSLLTAAMLAGRGRLDKAHVALAYLLVVLGASAAAGRLLGLTIAGISFLAFNFFFLPPYHTFVVADPFDWLVLVAFLVTSVVAAQLLYRATSTADTAMRRAEEVDRLAALGATSLSAPSADEALQAVARAMREAIGVDSCAVYRRDVDDTLVRAAIATREPTDAALGERFVGPDSLLRWLVDRGGSAVELADGTVHLAADGVRAVVQADARPARAVLLPLVARERTVGVLRVAAADGLTLSPEQARLLVALAHYAALGVERARLVETAERAEAERRVESLRSALLMAVSHDLRTPLTTIKGIAHEIAAGGDPRSAAIIESEADRLDALVGDLLDLSRIQAGAVRPDIAVNTADELVGAALRRSAGALGDHPVVVTLPPDDVLAGRFDFTQSLRVLVNLLENAAKYAPAGSPIDVHARRAGDRLLLSVLDRGPGIPASERARIFEPFYRPRGTPADVRGTGLGLSIARGLAEAQDGGVRYEARDGGGSAFVLDLPAVVERV